MLEFQRLCEAYEKMSSVERGLLLTEKSVTIMARLHCLSIPGMDPVSVLAGFIVGSVVADERINEKEYLMIYPALVSAFGEDFDFAQVKNTYRCDREGRKMTAVYTEEMLRILELLDEDLKKDVITLCLCVVAIDGKASVRERGYIRRLCRV